jgi:hypothetical protein
MYTNDAIVFVDVLLRKCANVPVGRVRTTHMQLLALFVVAMPQCARLAADELRRFVTQHAPAEDDSNDFETVRVFVDKL